MPVADHLSQTLRDFQSRSSLAKVTRLANTRTYSRTNTRTHTRTLPKRLRNKINNVYRELQAIHHVLLIRRRNVIKFVTPRVCGARFWRQNANQRVSQLVHNSFAYQSKRCATVPCVCVCVWMRCADTRFQEVDHRFWRQKAAHITVTQRSCPVGRFLPKVA